MMGLFKRRRPVGIHIKTPEEIEQMKLAGRISAQALVVAGELAVAGATTLDIDRGVEDFIRSQGATPTFKGYGGFPGSVCASINEKVVHGIPDDKTVLQEGDIISIDTGATINGWVGDNAYTFQVGHVDDQKRRLCEATEKAMWAGIEQAVPGNYLGDVGHAVQEVAESRGFGVVRKYVGHGVGHVMHEPPQVPNYGKRGRGVLLEEGMVIAIEPMVTAGTYQVHTIADGWGTVTNDGKPAAHFEKTVAITAQGPLVLTDVNV